MWTKSLRISSAHRGISSPNVYQHFFRRFHEYFVTHLPSSSLHPDGRTGGPHHKLPRDQSTPHNADERPGLTPAAPPAHPSSRDLTVVRIPLKSAKHHFGVSVSRGSRPHNEDTYQAGTIDLPAFAKRRPTSFTRSSKGWGSGIGPTSADGASGDPQVFYFGVFDGHGGNECSDFLRERLHEYLEDTARRFELRSSLQGDKGSTGSYGEREPGIAPQDIQLAGKEVIEKVRMESSKNREAMKAPKSVPAADPDALNHEPPESSKPVKQVGNLRDAEEMERELVNSWKKLVGGYFRRFKPEFFSLSAGGQGHILEKEAVQNKQLQHSKGPTSECIGIETVLSYAFLKADFDFVHAQANKGQEDPVSSDRALNDNDILGKTYRARDPPSIGGSKRFMGGSTCSLALISTPTPSPFWNPASPSTLLTAHVGDTRILLCSTATGEAIPMTTNHHPSHPHEAGRLRRFAATFVTDSFGEERVSGLANTRAFGDIASKRIGVSAEPEIRRMELAPAAHAFLVLVSDGVSGALSDQEIVDIVKEARTPEQGARDVVSFATEVASDPDNSTALVVRLGGWERRGEGGLGSMGTKEIRDWRRQEALDPRSRRQ
ncbi:protein serine/threonine phosphatase 2C [Aulographum hederae CBS 113979]|uniref:Protein serine/threonine phosphatase 2C n=1 Tax=Aulographum hederae CBS 113979 TaxID=1176131 RepID=A0A6G1GZJ0_9PEZI|nr:protein serine/threonine phosphatase 2C [Aulographum hederae CBS 113979]